MLPFQRTWMGAKKMLNDFNLINQMQQYNAVSWWFAYPARILHCSFSFKQHEKVTDTMLRQVEKIKQDNPDLT
jgi:lysozyme family protein